MQSVSVGGKASVALGDADAFAILDHDRRNIKAGVPSVVCLETDVADMRSCKPRNRIACGSSDAREIPASRGSSRSAVKLK